MTNFLASQEPLFGKSHPASVDSLLPELGNKNRVYHVQPAALLSVHPDSRSVADDSRVRHFEESAANPITIAATHLLIREPIAFLERPVGEIASTKLPLPIALGVNLINKNGSVLATMPSQVSLSVADNVEFEPKDMKFRFSR